MPFDFAQGRARIRDIVGRVTVGTLFTLFSIKLFGDFMTTGHITGLLLLVGEALVVVFTIVRRPARQVDRSALAAILTTVSLAAPPLLQVDTAAGAVPDALTAMVSAIGLVIVVLGKMTLGRSFGVAPANRGIVVRGPYAVVRHPIYAGYLATHVGFLMAHPAAWNVAVLVATDVALVLRALAEERVLINDVEYQGYCRRVGWHLVPGVF